jgi:nucleotide-binding universal stress UspA family protein
MNDIIVGVDPSDTARRAAETAASLASACGANLHLVTCVTHGKSRDVAIGSDHWHIDPLSEAETFLKDLARALPHDQITTIVGAGDPATTLCEEAARLDARMIVVGNRRVQGVSRLLGSIATDVARHAPCDVLIANTTAS